MTLGTEGQIVGDTFYIIIRIAEQVLRQPDLLMADVLLDRHPLHPVEKRGKPGRRHTDLMPDLPDHDLAVQVLENMVLRSLDQLIPLFRGMNGFHPLRKFKFCLPHGRFDLMGICHFLYFQNITVHHGKGLLRQHSPFNGCPGSQRHDADCYILCLPQRIPGKLSYFPAVSLLQAAPQHFPVAPADAVHFPPFLLVWIVWKLRLLPLEDHFLHVGSGLPDLRSRRFFLLPQLLRH